MTQQLPLNALNSGRPGSPAAPEVIVLQVGREFLKNFTYLAIDPRTRIAALIDPAWEKNKIDGLIAEAEVTLGAVLVTHAHPDHTDLAAAFAEEHQCPIWASAEALAQLPALRQIAQPVNGQRLQIGETPVEPILTPGHTAGCTCFRIGDNLFSGDTLFAEGCGMCPDVPAAHAMFESLEALKRRLRPTTRIYPGHSYGIPTGQPFATLLRENIYLQFNNKDDFTAFRLRSGQNLARMFQFS